MGSGDGIVVHFASSMDLCHLRGNAWKDLLTRIMKIICRLRNEFIESLQNGAQIYSNASSSENTRCKVRSGERIENTRENTCMSDVLTKGNFTRDEWNNLVHLFNISHFSSTCCTWNFHLSKISCSTMAKRIQEQREDERVESKSRPGLHLKVQGCR